MQKNIASSLCFSERYQWGRYQLAVCLATLGSACKSSEQKPDPAPRASTSVESLAAPPATPTAAPDPKAKPLAVEKEVYGDLQGQAVERYTLTNKHGLKLEVISYGAIITELHVPDRDGKFADIVLGFDELEDYVKGSPYFGATVGRVANRIKNARFELEGKKYKLAANDAPHHLHGGTKGWDKVVWNAQPLETTSGAALKLIYVSKDGEEGYPGTVTAETTYALTDDNELRVAMRASTDKTTLVNMAHHSYWNLGGHGSGPVSGHTLQLFASQYTPATGLVPSGSVAAVAGTPFDFTTPKAIGKDLAAAGGKPVGFDHNWVVDGEPHALRTAARLADPKSGRVMTVESDQPGIQFYSGNFLDGTAVGKGETPYAQYTGLCLETQKFPNSVNVPAWQKEVVLRPGQSYEHTMVHRFSVE